MPSTDIVLFIVNLFNYVLTMDEAKSKFGTKGRTNAGLTLGIIGTALAAFAGNNGGCGCGGILGNLFGGNNNCCAIC